MRMNLVIKEFIWHLVLPEVHVTKLKNTVNNLKTFIGKKIIRSYVRKYLNNFFLIFVFVRWRWWARRDVFANKRFPFMGYQVFVHKKKFPYLVLWKNLFWHEGSFCKGLKALKRKFLTWGRLHNISLSYKCTHPSLFLFSLSHILASL